ncbi:MAG: phage virion morphogenesis protein [Patescibacteria group bacterium]|nr:phage virion morphogenesis protein [Patescibacteria group bacterium]
MTTNANEIVAYIRVLDPRLRASLVRGVEEASRIDLQTTIRADKLSGQVLKVRTGTLRSSIQVRMNDSVDEIRGDVFTNLIYAKVHEYGKTITAKNVPFLKFQVDGRWVQKRQVTIPARPYMAPALREQAPAIITRLEAAIEETLSE